MKNRFTVIALCAPLLLAACVEFSEKGKSQVAPLTVTNEWKTLETVAYRGKRDDISFADENTGWYGTGKGDLYKTSDAGQTWSLVASQPGTFIRALGFIDENTGFIGNVGTDYYPGVEDETPLYRTDDSGANWRAVDLGELTIKGVCAIDIVTSERIYQGKLVPRTIIHAAGRVGGPTGILRSVDGGESWTVIPMDDHAGMILDIKFFDETTGLVFASTSRGSDNEGLILRTTDGGKNWQTVYQSGRVAELIWKASFPTEKTGYATVQSYDPEKEQQLIVKTKDGGRTWEELPLTNNAKARQFGIGFVDEEHGWVGTMEGGFYTADGGKSFSQAPIAKAANKIRVMKFQTGARIYAIGTEVQRLELEYSDQ